MKLTIRNIFIIVTSLLMCSGLLAGYYIFDLYKKTNELKDIEYKRHLLIKKADELRQSSDNLTKFANKYVITGNKKYKEIFFKINSIRKGESKRPLNYEGIYWDLGEELREKLHPLGEKISLRKEIETLPFTSYEIKKLNESKKHSDDLIKLEVIAFKSVEGLLENANKKNAIDFMNSEFYEKIKEKIMLPIDEFLLSVNARTKNDIKILNKEIDSVFRILFIIVVFCLILFLISLFLILKRVVLPMKHLTTSMSTFEIGKTNIELSDFSKDEIGFFAKHFYLMEKKINKDYKDIKNLSLTDPLTKIGNRRSFYDISSKIFKLAKRDNEDMSIGIVDIDYFKKINDTYGHLVGDEIIKHCVSIIKNTLRNSDIISRFGGEEFVVLLPKTDINGAKIICEKIRNNIEKIPYKDKRYDISFTVSIGISKLIENDTEINNIIQRSDNALYEAKKNGRNNIASLHLY